MKVFLFATISLSLFASSYAVKCWECTGSTTGLAQFECYTADNEFYGEIVDCDASNSQLKTACWKMENTDNKNVWRGCVPAANDPDYSSPWDDGYQAKNRCKKQGSIRQCTCKDNMCNSGFNVQSSVILMSVAAFASVVYGRM